MKADRAIEESSSRALLAMLAGAALIGTNALMVRYADVGPTVSAFWRMTFAGLFLLGLAVAQGRWQRLSPAAWAWSLLPAVAFAADLWLWHRSILLVGPGLATLLANAQVFFMALAGALFFGERLGPRFVAGIALAFAGLWLLLGQGWETLAPEYRWGVWLGLATGVCYAMYNVGLRTAQRRAEADGTAAPVVQVLAIVSLACALVLGVAGLLEGTDFAIPTRRAWVALLALAIFGHAISWILISNAMRALSVAMVGLLLLLQPIVAFLLDIALLGRETSAREWLGVAVSLAGIFVAGLKRRKRAPPPA